MINILLPALGDSQFFDNCYFPKLMLEICGETMLEKVVANFDSLCGKHFLFILNQKDCSQFHIDNSAKIVTEPDTSIIILRNLTGGALCTCLLAIEEIDSDTPLIIANSDQIIDVDYQNVLEQFWERDCDAGVITFPSVHPRWSYIAPGEDGSVLEVAEKRPLSRHAIAGFYYFRRGSDFIQSAKNAIRKKSKTNGKYYISASLNEMILMNKRVGYYEIGKKQYHSFYSPEKILEYENRNGGSSK